MDAKRTTNKSKRKDKEKKSKDKKKTTDLSKITKKSKDRKPKKVVGERTLVALVRQASDDALMTVKDFTPGEPPKLKKARTAGSFDADVMALETAPAWTSPFEIVKRGGLGEMTKVKLLPRVVTKDGKVSGISFGRGRTPSPFGSKMGDHTGSWTSVVDSVHARLFGKDVDAAVAELTTMQADAQKWMTEEDSTGMKLWNLLSEEDRDKRRPVLETYASTVEDVLTRARALLATRVGMPAAIKAVDDQLAELLAEGVAHHLAFVNYLPFTTVPAKGDAGSKGSGEGSARARVLDVELDVEEALQRQEFLLRESPDDRTVREKAEAVAEKELWGEETADQTARRKAREEVEAKAAKELQLENAHKGLWGLFAMDAAVRAADLDRVVAPQRIKEHKKQLQELQSAAIDVRALLGDFTVVEVKGPPPAKRRLSGTPKRSSTATQFSLNVDALRKTAKELQKADDLPYNEVQPLATVLINALDGMQGITKMVGPTQSDDFRAFESRIIELLPAINELVARLNVPAEQALEDGARLMAHLLHDHQSAVGRAYPNAVTATNFLGDKPEEDAKKLAAARVLAFINDREKGIKGIEAEPAKKLAEKIVEIHAKLGDAPAPGPNTRWVSDSSTASLIASFKADEVSIQGRPAAPPGVGGMGSHTTAWVTEVLWVQKKLAEVGKDEIVAELKEVTQQELNGELMTELAHHLPADQLAIGQLGIIFDAALDVLATDDPADAITAYLSFRNLLPYATVDAGNRGGSAERVGSDKNKLFDAKSLRAALAQKKDELNADRVKGTIKTLVKAADDLEKDYKAAAAPPVIIIPDAPEPELTWKSTDEMKSAVTTTIKNLRDEAARLQDLVDRNRDASTGVRDKIYNTRWTEHSNVFDYAKS